jgi:hypothetical protein
MRAYKKVRKSVRMGELGWRRCLLSLLLQGIFICIWGVRREQMKIRSKSLRRINSLAKISSKIWIARELWALSSWWATINISRDHLGSVTQKSKILAHSLFVKIGRFVPGFTVSIRKLEKLGNQWLSNYFQYSRINSSIVRSNSCIHTGVYR